MSETKDQKTRSLGQRIRLAFLAVSGLSLLTTLVAFIGFNAVERQQARISQIALPTLVQSRALVVLISELDKTMKELIAVEQSSQLKSISADIRDEITEINLNLDLIEDKDLATENIAQLRMTIIEISDILEAEIKLVQTNRELSVQQHTRTQQAHLAISQMAARIKPMILEVSDALIVGSDELTLAIENSDRDRSLLLVEQFTNSDIVALERLVEMESRITRLEDILKQLALEIDTSKVRELKAKFDLSLRTVSRLALELSDLEIKSFLAQPLSTITKLGIAQNNIFATRASVIESDAQIAILEEKKYESNLKLNYAIAALSQQVQKFSADASIRAQNTIEMSRWILMAMVIVTISGALLIAWFYVIKNIATPLDKLTRATRDLASGNLNVSIPKTGDRELTMLAQAIDVFKDNAILVTHQTQELGRRADALKNSEERYAIALEGIAAGIWDREDITQEAENWSSRLYELLGYSPGEIEATHTNFTNLVHTDDRGILLESINAHIEHNSPHKMELRLKHLSGQYRWYLVSGQVARDASGKAVRMAGSVIDIDSRKQAEMKLADQTEDLKRSNLELEQFAYVASHDLQEPLRMVVSYCDLLQRRHHQNLNEEAQKFMDFATNGAKRMQQLIQDLLQYSRAGRQPIKAKPDSIEEALASTIKILEVRVKETQAKIVHTKLPMAIIDRLQIGLVFQNLIQNALKFHGKHPPIIKIEAEIKDQFVEISVTDNGIGIDPKFTDKIFEIFQRLHSREEYEGTGIGLSIVKQIIIKHGGTIWIDTSVRQGACFRFTLPLVKM